MSIIQQIEVLIELQELETQIRKASSVLEEMPHKLEALEEEKQALRQAVENASDALGEWKRRYREQESESQMMLNRIDKSRAKLQQVKTNKEYTSSLKEIDELKHQHSMLEDAMLECLDRIEEEEKQLQKSSKEMELQTAELDDALETLQQEMDRIRERIQSLSDQAGAVSERVPDDLKQVYQRVKSQQPRGIALARVTGAVCQGCNMNIPPQLYIELQRRDRLQFCPNCQR
ncbi:MAG: C4-type zinc ribbon domain-containing protein, partial [Desulfobacteraceae bacterium]|nr:C4-type zinc ribbon domain-containing protein [Desulfobacteraceae bacterium]